MELALIGILLFGLALIGIPVAMNMSTHPMGAIPSTAMLLVGIGLVIMCAILFIFTKLYVRTRADEAFVRTGTGGARIVRDGGSIVLPFLHEIVKVSLATIRLLVERKGTDALITADKLRADIRAEFFVRVQPEDDSIQTAARSLGNKMTDETEVAALIEDKLVNALRTASARKTLEQLNSDREEFVKEITAMVTSDLAHNGFMLESVTISKLDQTDVTHMKETNIFDAQGLRSIAEITQTNLTRRNELTRNGERERTAQDVAARQQILALERTKAEAEATQATQIATIQADQTRVTQEKQIESERLVQTAQVEQARLVQLAKQKQEQDIAVANQVRLKAQQEAEQTVDVARRARETAVAQAEAEKALAEAKLAAAETERTTARQLVITAEQIAIADREGKKSVIAATALAEQAYVKDAKGADAKAYTVRAEAEARKTSADAEAEATRKKAEAEAQAAKLRAEGEKNAALARAAGEQAALEAQAAGQRAVALAQAEGQRAVAMVPVEVAEKQVAIDKARVETVLVPELEAREKSGKAAQDFDLARLRIEGETRVRIEGAKVMATVLNKVTANVYGTPEDVAKMTTAFNNGMGLSGFMGGFFDGANNSPDLVSALSAAGKLAQAATERLTTNGTAITPSTPLTPPAE